MSETYKRRHITLGPASCAFGEAQVRMRICRRIRRITSQTAQEKDCNGRTVIQEQACQHPLVASENGDEWLPELRRDGHVVSYRDLALANKLSVGNVNVSTSC